MVVRVGGRVVVDGVGHVEAVGTDGVVDPEAGTCATGSGTSISAASR